MCVVAVKKFPGIGWVGVKNRDRNYLPTVKIVQSNIQGLQRLYLDDLTTRYTEGLNEYGVSIISASLAVKEDEKEGKKVGPGNRPDGYMSPDGKTIRTALLEKTAEAAVKVLQDRKLAGCTYVFDEKNCYLLEGGYNLRIAVAQERGVDREYTSKLIKVTDNFHVRTNHGILIPELGYQMDSKPEMKKNRKSSESRLKIAQKMISRCQSPEEMMDALAEQPDNDTFMNPLRTGDIEAGDMCTTGQLLLNPKDRTMHYRPIYSEVEFKYNKLNGEKSKTFFEIITSRELLNFREWVTNLVSQNPLSRWHV